MLRFLCIAAAVILFYPSCRNTSGSMLSSANVDSVKNIILQINSEQQSLYRNLPKGKERAKKYLSFCYDSLITITGYGNQLTNALDASNDLAQGYADTIHNITVRVYGNTAILTGRGRMFDMLGKDTLFEDIWISKVFINFDGKWKMVLRSSGPLGVNYSKEKPLSSKQLSAFEGVYGINGEFLDTFSVVSDHLYQLRNNQPGLEYFALDDSTFFTKDDPGAIIFKRDAEGIVTHFEWRAGNGQVFRVGKIR